MENNNVNATNMAEQTNNTSKDSPDESLIAALNNICSYHFRAMEKASISDEQLSCTSICSENLELVKAIIAYDESIPENASICSTKNGELWTGDQENISVTNMAKMTSEAFDDCLYRDEYEDRSGEVWVEGIKHKYGFHPQRLEEKRKLVTALIANLPAELSKKGLPFTGICVTKTGELWTGNQEVCEELIVMGIGLGLMKYSMPRELWQFFGGVPYITLV